MEKTFKKVKQRYFHHQNLSWSVVFFFCFGLFVLRGMIFRTHHQDQKQDINKTYEKISNLQTGKLTTSKTTELLNTFSGFDIDTMPTHLQKLYQGTMMLLQAYQFGVSTGVTSIRTGFLLAQSANDTLQNAILLAPSTSIYNDIQRIYIESQKLVSTLQIKLCYAGLDQAKKLIGGTQKFIERYQKLLTQLIYTLTKKYTDTNDKEFKQCLSTILQRLGKNKKAFTNYQQMVEKTSHNIEKEYTQKLRQPDLCLITPTLSVNIPFSGNIPTSFYRFYQQHQTLLFALQKGDKNMLMQYCKNEDSGSSQAQQDMEQMIQDMEKMQKKQEPSLENKEQQGSQQKNHKQLNEYQEKAVEAIEQKGNTYYRNMQRKKQQGESSLDALEHLFRTFDAYQQDFIDHDQRINSKTQGY